MDFTQQEKSTLHFALLAHYKVAKDDLLGIFCNCNETVIDDADWSHLMAHEQMEGLLGQMNGIEALIRKINYMPIRKDYTVEDCPIQFIAGLV